MSWTLDIDDIRLPINNTSELHQQLLEQHVKRSQRPAIALLTAPDGACLGIGLGGRLSTLTYIASGGWPAMHSVGDEVSGFVEYSVAGQLSELPARCLIPMDKALRAAALFYADRQLDKGVIWEED